MHRDDVYVGPHRPRRITVHPARSIKQGSILYLLSIEGPGADNISATCHRGSSHMDLNCDPYVHYYDCLIFYNEDSACLYDNLRVKSHYDNWGLRCARESAKVQKLKPLSRNFSSFGYIQLFPCL